MVLLETRYARRAGGTSLMRWSATLHSNSPGRRRAEPRRGDLRAPRRAEFNPRVASFSRLIRFDQRGAGLSDPPFHQIPDLELGEVEAGAEPYPPDGCWATPDLDAGAGAMRPLYDHPDVAGELGRRARASVTAIHDATVAWFGERFAAVTGAGADR
ncbi:MAG: hypothetical protein ACRDWD_01730 [Acidimicrobiia bacterium]